MNPTKKYLKNTFGYCFKDYKDYPSILDAKILKKKHLLNDLKTQITIKSLKVHHGSIRSICYIINDKCAYAPDVNKIDNKDLKFSSNTLSASSKEFTLSKSEQEYFRLTPKTWLKNSGGTS